jgi:hypothetical protein
MAKQMKNPFYPVSRVRHRPELLGLWDGLVWCEIPRLTIASYRPEGSRHRPVTRVKLAYDIDGLFALFQVHDNYVRCLRTRFQDPVYKDSCVEFFVQPKSESGVAIRSRWDRSFSGDDSKFLKRLTFLLYLISS